MNTQIITQSPCSRYVVSLEFDDVQDNLDFSMLADGYTDSTEDFSDGKSQNG